MKNRWWVYDGFSNIDGDDDDDDDVNLVFNEQWL